MSAASGEGSGGGVIGTVVLKGLAWFGCVLVLLVIAAERAANLEGRDIHFKQGYALGSVVFSLVAAFAVWLVVQHAIRKRSGFPPWIGVIAIGVSFLLLFVDMGTRGVAQAACVPAAKSYGSPPAGWTYARADPTPRAQVIELLDPVDRADADVTTARDDYEFLTLIAVANANASYVAGADNGAKKAGARISKTSYGASVHDHPNGNRAIVGTRGCNVVLIIGRPGSGIDTVARAIFLQE